MTTVLRWVACGLLAAAAFPAFARSPMSNGTGDGEANVPFAATEVAAPADLGGGSGEPGAVPGDAMSAPAFAPVSNGCADGEANVPFAAARPATTAEEIGGGSGEPGRIEPRDAATLARDAEAWWAEFERHIWTDP